MNVIKVRFPAAHSYGGYAFRHEANQENKPNRVSYELPSRRRDRIWDATLTIPAIFNPYQYFRFWRDCFIVYSGFCSSLLSTASNFRMAEDN